MKKSDKNEDWTDQSLREVIEIDPVHDLKGYNNPETLRQALGRLTFTRHEKKNQGKHYPRIFSKVLTGPLERIKIIQQTEQVWKAGTDPNLTQRSFTGLLKEIKEVQGWKALWRGTAPNVIKTVPNSFINWLIADWLRLIVLYKGEVGYRRPEKYSRTAMVNLFSSMVANLVVYPLERLRVIMSLNMADRLVEKPENSVIRMTYKLFKADKFRSLYKGYWFNSAVTVPYTVISLASYDFYRFTVLPQGHIDLYLRYILLGIGATFTTQVFLYPLDTVRRIIQADSTLIVPKRMYKNARSCLFSMAKHNPRALYRGFLLSAWKTPLQTSLQVWGYEHMRSSMEDFLKQE